ncbi:MAG: hypothetical protein FWF94_08270 [Oscillospiraceae bacterium]|nr:hypothetical protein [Oscillospiraceae bacterium]
MKQYVRFINKFRANDIEDSHCFCCLYYGGNQQGCTLKKCCCGDINQDFISHERIERSCDYNKWDL